MIIDQLMKVLPIGARIPKPKKDSDYRVHRWGLDNLGKSKLVYSFPSNASPIESHKKTIKEDEIIKSHERLETTGKLTTAWYSGKFPEIYSHSPCNFTTIGGLFVKLGIARYEKAGLYVKV